MRDLCADPHCVLTLERYRTSELAAFQRSAMNVALLSQEF